MDQDYMMKYQQMQMMNFNSQNLFGYKMEDAFFIDPQQKTLLEKYCLCEIPQEIIKAMNNSQLSSTQDSYSKSMSNASPKPHKVKQRKRKNALPPMDDKLYEIMQQISTGEIVGFKASPKSIKGMYRNKSGRRSRYIGVSKNSQNWQVLINLGNFKKYIGTYSTEKEAAIAYDFFSIALNGSKANTNFDYDISLITEMIESYLASDKEIVPAYFVNRV